jgi:DNA-directed RNA polymerase omega subunit
MSNQIDQHGLTSQVAAKRVGGLFDLVLIASRRVRELKSGYASHIKPERHGHSVTAIREIEEGHIGKEYLYLNQDPSVTQKSSKGTK